MEPKSFFATLFDFTFSEFITARLIKVFFILGIAGSALSTFSVLVGGFAHSFMYGLVMLVLSPLVFLLMVLGCRVWLELIMLGFKIAENTAQVAQNTRKS